MKRSKDYNHVYNPGQVKNILPYLADRTEWFLLGGPADGDEAQALNRLRPGLKMLACEPNPLLYQVQYDRKFPGLLLPCALWSERRSLDLYIGCGDNERQIARCSSVAADHAGQVVEKVRAETLNYLTNVYGPFTNAFLWLDVEGAELQALQGAANLFADGQIVGVNVEVFSHNYESIHNWLTERNMLEKRRWDHHKQGDREWWNSVYVLKG